MVNLRRRTPPDVRNQTGPNRKEQLGGIPGNAPGPNPSAPATTPANGRRRIASHLTSHPSMKLNDIPNSQYDLGPLPEMETYDDAVAVSEKEHDQFFVAAFRLKSWLADLLIEGFTRLAPESRQPCGSPQTGQAWRGFLEVFGPLSDHELPYVIGVLHRFVKYNDPLPELPGPCRTWHRASADRRLHWPPHPPRRQSKGTARRASNAPQRRALVRLARRHHPPRNPWPLPTVPEPPRP